MEAGEWEPEFNEARQRLLESRDFDTLCGRGHILRNGVVLTSVSDSPFEMSLKCMRCGTVFWFANAGWSTGGPVHWQISSTSVRQASMPCPVH
jgi:hypothetical protein